LEFGKFGKGVLEKNTQYGHIDNSYVKIFEILKLANFSISRGYVYIELTTYKISFKLDIKVRRAHIP